MKAKKLVIYIHGQGGNPEEARHYEGLFKDSDVVGFDYGSQTPWEAKEEFPKLFDSISEGYESVTLVANSIGAYLAMSSLSDKKIEKAYFISPVVDMEKLIRGMMMWAGVTEDELREKRVIKTAFGQDLSWEYLSYAKAQEMDWKIPTHVLYGRKDHLASFDTIADYAKETGASLTVMEDGEHWFHTKEQMEFLDDWICSKL